MCRGYQFGCVVFSLLLSGSVSAQEALKGFGDAVGKVYIGEKAPTFLDAYLWKQVSWQGVPQADGSLALSQSEPWGGRVVGGLGFGRFGFEARLDVSGLKDQFNFQDPSTYQSIEAYGMVHYVAFTPSGLIQIGPALVAGSISSFEKEASFKGFGLDLFGGGARLAVKGSELEFLVARTNYLRDDPKIRAVAVLHLKLTSQMSLVGDVVSGEDGFVRGGIAVRAF